MVQVDSKSIYKSDTEIQHETMVLQPSRDFVFFDVNEADVRRFIARPDLLRGIVPRGEFEAVRMEIENMKRSVMLDLLAHEEILNRYERRLSAVETRLQAKLELKEGIQRPNVEILRQRSRENAARLRVKLGLKEDPARVDGFAKIRGLLKKYADDDEDSVEFLRKSREDS